MLSWVRSLAVWSSAQHAPKSRGRALRSARLAALLGALGAAGVAHAAEGDAYYMAIYAAQNGEAGIDPASHDWAVFVRMPRAAYGGTTPVASDDDGDPRPHVVPISWLPARLPICVMCTEPVPGRNYELRETIEIERRAGLRVSQWGPYEIDEALFDDAVRQAERLASGAVRYVVWDKGLRPHVLNCIHAVSDVDTTHPPLATGPAIGDAAGEALQRFYWPHFRARSGRGAAFRRQLGVGDLVVMDRTP